MILKLILLGISDNVQPIIITLISMWNLFTLTGMDYKEKIKNQRVN